MNPSRFDPVKSDQVNLGRFRPVELNLGQSRPIWASGIG